MVWCGVVWYGGVSPDGPDGPMSPMGHRARWAPDGTAFPDGPVSRPMGFFFVRAMALEARWARWGSFPDGPDGVHFPMGPMARWDSLFELVVEIDTNVARWPDEIPMNPDRPMARWGLS